MPSRALLVLLLLLSRYSIGAYALAQDLVVLSEGKPPTTTATFDFGTVDPLKTPSLQCTFVLCNRGTAPVTIQQVQPTCGCTTTWLGEEQNQTLQLAPQQTVRLRAFVQLDRLGSGPFSKQIYVFTSQSSGPAISLEIKGDVLPLVAFYPSTLSFSKVPFGTPCEAVLTAILDRRLAPSNSFPVLQTSLSTIRIVPQGPPQPCVWNSRPAVRRTYKILLNTHYLGAQQGSLYFFSTKPSANSSNLFSNYLGNTAVYLRGEVVGAFQVTPQVVVLGSTVQGNTVITGAVLQTTQPKLWQGLHVRSSAPYLRVQWMQNSHNPNRRVLRIKLEPNAPVGTLSLSILVRAMDGETLMVPVYGIVYPKEQPTP